MMPNDNGIVEVKDFQFSPITKKFRMYQGDDFIFEAPAALPIGVLEEAVRMRKLNVNEDGVTEKILAFFDRMLLPEAAAEMRRRATQPGRFPFGLDHLQPIMEWLLESYGLRPTQPSSPSSSGSTADDSTSSTAGAPSEASTPSDSPSTDSSTSFTTTSLRSLDGS